MGFFSNPCVKRLIFRKTKISLGEEWFKIGFRIGYTKISLPILLSPYYGVRYYFNWLKV